jgi:hypothetical protein
MSANPRFSCIDGAHQVEVKVSFEFVDLVGSRCGHPEQPLRDPDRDGCGLGGDLGGEGHRSGKYLVGGQGLGGESPFDGVGAPEHPTGQQEFCRPAVAD